MLSENVILFGVIISSWKNKENEWVLLIEDKSKAIDEKKWSALPKKYEVTVHHCTLPPGSWKFRPTFRNPSLPDSFTDESNTPAWENIPLSSALVAFSIQVNFHKNKKISGFRVCSLISLNIAQDVELFLKKIYETNRASSTDLPLSQYLNYIGRFDRSETNIVFNDIKYEVLLLGDSLEPLLKKNVWSSYSRELSLTLVSLQKDNVNCLNIYNFRSIYDKFYRPVYGLGFNGEYRYGEAVHYQVTCIGDIVHVLSIDKVKNTEDSSSDRTSSTKTTVLRLGDRLSDEMIDFLKEPVKGHYTPTVLF
jgi:hypothetical protein